MIDTIIALLDEGQEQDTAIFTIEKGEAEFANGDRRRVWQARLDYYHGDGTQSGGGIGATPDQAVADLLRMVRLGKAEEKATLSGESDIFQMKIDGAVDLYPLPEARI